MLSSKRTSPHYSSQETLSYGFHKCLLHALLVIALYRFEIDSEIITAPSFMDNYTRTNE